MPSQKLCRRNHKRRRCFYDLNPRVRFTLGHYRRSRASAPILRRLTRRRSAFSRRTRLPSPLVGGYSDGVCLPAEPFVLPIPPPRRRISQRPSASCWSTNQKRGKEIAALSPYRGGHSGTRPPPSKLRFPAYGPGRVGNAPRPPLSPSPQSPIAPGRFMDLGGEALAMGEYHATGERPRWPRPRPEGRSGLGARA